MHTQEMESQVAAVAAAPKLEMTRVIRASRARVYDAWTRPEVLKQWFAPGEMIVPGAALDVREGGEFEIQMSVPVASPDLFVARGTYRRVAPNSLLQFTWSTNCSPAETSLVTISFEDVEGGTRLTLKHEQFATEDSRDRHEQGWGGSLTKLAGLMEA